ncbi:MAG TPA: DNA translocase FtsK 4TM domain-containing protein [Burkholderiales bacterium]|nr:DNA translocase FtsK 4TM domain-containing protein [Burkholderiales bacterium]
MALERAASAAKPPASSRVARLLSESRWLLFAGLAVYLVMILATYHHADTGWSHDGGGPAVANAGGRFGAWFADLILYVFGLSAWWWVALFSYLVIAGYKRMADRFLGNDATVLDRRSMFALFGGFALLLLSSAALESVRFYSLKVGLPLAPGGLVGAILGRLANTYLGFTGATLLLLLGCGIGLSLFTGISWLAVAERIGTGLEWAYDRVRRRMEEREDRELGAVAQVEREQIVVEERRELFDDHSTIRIEPGLAEVPQSPRVEKEKQAPLFSDLPDTGLPPLHLLDAAAANLETVSPETVEFTSRLIEKKLKDFGVQVEVKAAYPGPVITRYEIEPAVGIKGSQIVGLAKDLARALSLVSIRVVETIPGKSLMGLELPNPKRQMVRLSEILGSQVYNDNASALTMALGKDIAGKPVVADLAKMPHLLVAGTTGSGKSVGINAMILSLLYKAEARDVRLILIDPKMLEMSVYGDIPHLLAPVVTDMKQAANALNWCVAEMERRYKLMSSQGVRNLAGFNTKVADAAGAGKPLTNPFTITPDSPEPLEHLPFIVVVIDELADLMMVAGKKIEELIARLAQKARASGIHLILATQRPSVDVITGLIKANIPTRISFQVSSKIDSRTILDQMGAESLLGQGDMLYLPSGSGLPARVHGAFVADEEVHRVVDYLKKLGGVNYIEGILEGGVLEGDAEGGVAGEGGAGGDAESDPMYDQAVEIVLKNKRASISLVQRHLRIGYNRAARLLDAMEKAGLVSTMQTNGNRDILIPAKAE